MADNLRCSVSIKCSKCAENNQVKYDSKMISHKNEKWHQKLRAKLVQKSQSIGHAKEVIMKMIDKKNVLETELRRKNEEIGNLKDKVLKLTRELEATTMALEIALEETQLLKNAFNDFSPLNKTTLHEKIFSRKNPELAKSDKLVDQKRQKIRIMKNQRINLQRWTSMKYKDFNYFDILQKNNYLQKEWQKKIDVSQVKDEQIQQKSELLNKMRDHLKHRSPNVAEDMEYANPHYFEILQNTNYLQKQLKKKLDLQQCKENHLQGETN